jgi:DNA-binding LacI/PurR family transcriptional regulator
VATVYEVAAKSGVSHMTVSNVFRHPDRVSRAVTERVLRAATELGFDGPNPAAASLRTGRIGTIGVILTESLSYAFSDPAAVALLQGVAKQFTTGGISVLPVNDPDRATEAIGTAAIDGLLAYSLPPDHPALRSARQRRLPLVLIDTPPRKTDTWVGIDDAGAAAQAAQHVIDLGHRRIAIVADLSNRPITELRLEPGDATVDLQRFGSSISRQRTMSYLATLEAAMVPKDVVGVIDAGTNSVEAGFRSVADLLALPTRPTAILAVSDQLANGVRDCLYTYGLSVPTDISVVGFDDSPFGHTLTTIRQPLVEKGRLATELLMSLIGHQRSTGTTRSKPRAQHITLPTELIVRSTTGPAPA